MSRETTCNVKLIGHTQLAAEYRAELVKEIVDEYGAAAFKAFNATTDGQMVALTAIRTCYSHLVPDDILQSEFEKYFMQLATEGEGNEADRLCRDIHNSKHLSTLEHVSFNFAVSGISRSLLAQFTRHRIGWSYSVQSQRYVGMGTSNKSGGFDYIVPPSVKEADKKELYLDIAGFAESLRYVRSGGMLDGAGVYVPVRYMTAEEIYEQSMMYDQLVYDELRAMGVPQEDARYKLPNAAVTNMTVTANIRALLDYYGKRKPGKGAQWEISGMTEQIKEQVLRVEPWLKGFFV